MSDAALLRWLELVQRQLGALDARIEIGGREPGPEAGLWAKLAGSRRVVVRFAAPPADWDEKRRRLDMLVAAFPGLMAVDELPSVPSAGSDAQTELAEALGRLAARADAVQALVFDLSSPVLWGTSHESPPLAVDEQTARRRGELVEQAERAGLELGEWLTDFARQRRAPRRGPRVAAAARQLAEELVGIVQRCGETRPDDWRRWVLAVKAVAACRRTLASGAPLPTAPRPLDADDGTSWLGRSLAGIYVLLLVFDRSVSELHAEGAVIRTLGLLESLVLALPPVDPPPKRGAKVVRLRRGRR